MAINNNRNMNPGLEGKGGAKGGGGATYGRAEENGTEAGARQDTKRHLTKLQSYPGPVFFAAAKQVSEALYRDLGRSAGIAGYAAKPYRAA